MRTKNAFKNIIIAVVAQCTLLVVGLLLRRILLNNFDVELVAYEGMISNIFSLLAVAGMGASSMFHYRMYRAFAREDQDLINWTLSLFRTLYRSLALLLTILCAIVFFLLPVIFGDRVQYWGYFRIMYLLYAVSAISSYVFGYWHTLLIAGQKEYKIVITQTLFQMATQIMKVVVLWTTKDFLLYLLLTTCSNLAETIIIAKRSQKEYPQVKIKKSTLQDCRNEGMLKELKDLFIHRLSSALMYSTDSILITLLVDVRSTALYNNYLMIATRVMGIFDKLVSPMRAMLADAVNKESKETSFLLYRTIDLYCFFLASILFICYVVVFQPAITVFFGGQFLLTGDFVFAYALQYYVNMKYQGVIQVRCCFGDYEIERNCAICGMIINFVLSILLGYYYGLMGVIMGTVIASLALWNGYFIIVDKKFFQLSLLRSWTREVGFLLLALIELWIVRTAVDNIPYTFAGMIIRGIIGVTVPTILNCILFAKTNTFRNILEHLRTVFIRRGTS